MKKLLPLSLLFLLLSSCSLNFSKASSETNNSSFDDLESSLEISSSSFSKESDSSFSSNSYIDSLTSEEESSSSSYFPYIEEGYYRVAPKFETSSTIAFYNLDGSIYKTIRKSTLEDPSTWYIDPIDLAFYYSSFRSLPVNYIFNDTNLASSSLQTQLNKFNKKGRLYSKDYSRVDGYMASIPEPYEYKYFEIDIAKENSSYTAKSRGRNRLVVVYNGLKQYNSTAPIIFYTTNHYSSFKEFTNFAKIKNESTSLKCFGKEFDGEGNGFGSYIKPATVSILNKTPLI
ncbi:MAG TPA: hypothetical protein DCR94_06080 [Firmicutes bacterium]|nr:hypothetical protein [Bacillota bacterium]